MANEQKKLPTLNAEPPSDTVAGESAMVIDAIRHIDSAKKSPARKKAEDDWKNIDNEKEYEYETADRSGVRKREGNILHIAEQKTMSKVKALSFSVHGDGATEDEEYIVTQGLMTIAEKGGFVEALKGERGAIREVAGKGDSFVHVYIDKDHKYPIRFKGCALDRTYIDASADVLRSKSGAQSADEVLVVYDMGYDQYLDGYKNYENSK